MQNGERRAQEWGTVYLVGAGSDAGMLTREGLRLLRQADCIVYDDLLDASVLAEACASCERISVGKRYKSHKKEQEEIHEILIEKARQGKLVVRLKGGDPTVFGRGGEEYLAVTEEGIRCEIIPGVSSCIAAPAHMGIPVTHRGLASSFTVVTGHGAKETAESYETLAGLKGTLVYLMGLHKAGEIAEGLIGAGKDPQTPVSVLSRVFTQDEERRDGTLADLSELARDAQAPAILVIGPTAGLHLRKEMQDMQDMQERPYTLVVGTASFTRKMAALLQDHDLPADECPCMGIVEDRLVIPAAEELAEYDWAVFTSANGVRIFLDELRSRKTDIRILSRMKFACIGPGTAALLEEQLLYADLIPEIYTAEALAEALVNAVRPGQKVLILRALYSNPILTKMLEREKIQYKECHIYNVQYMEQYRPVQGRHYAYIVFASAGGVRGFLTDNEIPEGTVPVCIGESTAAELERLTGCRGITADECSAQGILQSITTHHGGRK